MTTTVADKTFFLFFHEVKKFDLEKIRPRKTSREYSLDRLRFCEELFGASLPRLLETSFQSGEE